MNKYEAMFILSPSLNEEELTKLKSSLSHEIQQNQGKVEGAQDLGKKKLAFVIKKQKDGFYHVINFEANPSSIKTLKDSYRLNETILRVLILRREN